MPERPPEPDTGVLQGLDAVIPALVMDDETTILSINESMATLWGRSVEELESANLVSLIFEGVRWTGVMWVSPVQQIALLKTYMEDAKSYGRTGAEVLFYTPNQMLYRGSVNVQWRRASDTYLVWFNFNDTVTQRDPHGVNQVWADGETIFHSDGPEIRQSDIDLLEHYTRSRSLNELAESYGMTYKSLEHRLRQLAEAHGHSSITEFTKSLAGRILKRFARPHNTMRLYNNLPELDTARVRQIPTHRLPSSLRAEDHAAGLVEEELEDWLADIKRRQRKRREDKNT